MEDATPHDNEENDITNGEEKERKKKKKKHKHKKKKGSDSEDEEEKKTIDKKNQAVIKDLIADCFVLLHVIGKGSFGHIYISYNLRENLPVSVKKEEKKIGKTPQLKTESKIYQSLLNIQADDISGSKPLGQDDVVGVPKFYGVGELPDCYYMIIDFLGPNLLELFNYCGCKKFTISCICLIALQVLNRIENLHKHHYLHRDIKPENFLIGIHEKSNIIHLIDFGLSKRYKNQKTHQHIPYREGRALTGTARYVSINTHLGIEQSRRDDLESIGYMLVFFLKGVLPWQGLKNGNEKYTRIMEKKLQIPTEILCYGLPDEITYYLNYCKSLRFEDRPDYDYLRGLFIKLLGSCHSIYGLTKEMLKFDWCFEDPATSIWLIFNKKNKANNASNINSSCIKEKEEGDENSKKTKNDVIKLKKQLSNISEVNDFVSNENNPNYEKSNSSESGGSKKDDNKSKKKKEIDDKNLIKEEENESKADESEETVRESFQPVPQDLGAGKLNEELKNVFFQQAKEEGIDKYINKLMNPAQPANSQNIDLIKFDEVEIIKNDNLNNNKSNNNVEKISAGKKPSLEKIKEESEKKELISSGESSNKKKGDKGENANNQKENDDKNLIPDKNANQNEAQNLIDEDKKDNSNKNSKESKKSGKENLTSSVPIVEGQNEKKEPLERPMINSKKYSEEMETKLKNMEKEGGEKLNFNQLEINNINIEDKKKEENKNNDNNQNNNKEEKKEENKEEKKEEEKKEDNKKNEKSNEVKENEDKETEEKKNAQKSNKELINNNTENKEKQDKISQDKISDYNALPKIQKEESEPKDKNAKKEKKAKKEEEDIQYTKSFKTTKAKKNHNKGGILQNNLSKPNGEKDRGKKSLKTAIKITPEGPTPEGDTPSGNDSLPKMKVSKENLIKISTEPVANFYSIVKDLGHGSYGQVKKVKHKQLGEIRAMKITNKKSDSSKYEIEILRKISHPNITNIFEIFADSKKYYVIMEFLEGGELFEAITSIGSFTEASACKVMKQILSAVFYLHSNRIVHRDLKPENIMLTQKPKNGNYQIKLIDFGTAKIFKPGKKMNKFIGTSYYIAPEVLKERYDEKCDVWSCGVILFILLCGYPPFNGNTNVDIFHAIQNQNPIFGGEEWEDITPEAKDLIKLMLKKNPNERLSAEMCLKHKWFKMLDDIEKNKHGNKNFKQIQLNAINHMSQFVNENRFKQAVLQFISTQFNIQREEGDLRELFKSMDVSGTGQLTKEEFSKKLVELYGENDGKEMASNIFNSLDLDGSGKISYDEFLSAMISSKKVVTEERLEKAFKMFDKDNSGKLSVKEIRNVFGGTEEQWKHVINEVDLNNDGEVDFGEFKIMMVNMNKNHIIQRKKTSEKSKDVSED